MRIFEKHDGFVKQSIAPVKACFSGMFWYKEDIRLIGSAVEIRS